MRFATTAASVAALVAAASAQNPITITVGQNGLLKFDPQFVNASANDVISFVFTGGNHSVSQSSFASPCEPLEGGFSSGFVPVAAAGSGTIGTWNLTVTDDTKAIWFYCAQGPNPAPKAHCEAGMVGGINIEKSNNTGDAYIAKATEASTFIQPTTTALSAPLAFASATPLIASGSAPSSSPTGTGSNGTNTGSGASPTSADNGAAGLTTGGFFAFVAAALGVAVL